MRRPWHPCTRDCPGQSSKCYASCGKYAAYEDEMKAYYKAEMVRKDTEAVLISRHVASRRKWRRRVK